MTSVIPNFNLFGSSDETGEERLKRRIYRAIEPEAIRAAKAKTELEVIKVEGERASQKADRVNELSQTLETLTGVKLKDFPTHWRVKLYFKPELTEAEMTALIDEITPEASEEENDSLG